MAKLKKLLTIDTKEVVYDSLNDRRAILHVHFFIWNLDLWEIQEYSKYQMTEVGYGSSIDR